MPIQARRQQGESAKSSRRQPEVSDRCHVACCVTKRPPAGRLLGFRGSTARAARTALNAAEQAVMTVGWIVLGIVGWVLGLVVVLTLFRMAGDQDQGGTARAKAPRSLFGRDDHATPAIPIEPGAAAGTWLPGSGWCRLAWEQMACFVDRSVQRGPEPVTVARPGSGRSSTKVYRRAILIVAVNVVFFSPDDGGLPAARCRWPRAQGSAKAPSGEKRMRSRRRGALCYSSLIQQVAGGRLRFELTVPLPARRISSPVHSTTLPTFRDRARHLDFTAMRHAY